MVKRPHAHTVNHVATLRCDVSLTAIRSFLRTCFSGCCCFSDSTISQGSVATHLRCGRILIIALLEIYC